MLSKTKNPLINNLNILREDIQCLRGFSVIIVLLYHFDFDLIKSDFINAGYIGVDIFFIISGYIITKIISEQKKISFKNFYIKRFKRLAPTLLVVILFSIMIAFFLFENFLLKKNIHSAFSSIFGFSNFYFWLSNTIYQFAEKNNMILMHTWSLSVEFQFYLFFPLMFYLFQKNLIKIILLIFFFISFFLIFYLHEKHNIFNFYASTSRVFEIVSGCLAFFYQKEIKNIFKTKNNLFYYSFGFILILTYMLFLSEEDYHPNPSSIIFVLGTCMMLIFYTNTLVVLNKLKLNFIGNISYSLYLWHFPIIVFGNYFFENYDDKIKFFLLIFCFLLSILSFYFLEKKFRYQNLKKNLWIFYFSLFLLSLISIISHNTKNVNNDNYFLADEANVYLNNRNKFYLKKSRNIFSFENDYKKFSPGFSNKDTKKILIMGDSHSRDVFNLFYSHKSFYTQYEFARYGINLVDFENKRLNYLINSEIFKMSDTLIFSQRYKPEDIILIEKLYLLSKKYKKNLVLILKKPEFKKNNHLNMSFIDEYIKKNNHFTKNELDKLGYENINTKEFEAINDKIKSQFSNKIKLIDLYEIICSDDLKVCYMTEKQKKNFYDYGHFTLSGANFFGEKIINKKFYKRILNEYDD